MALIDDINKNDNVLLEQVKRGSESAFKDLFYRYVDPLERFITYYIQDRGKAQDLVIDIFMYIWENRETFLLTYTLKSYLFQAAKNKALTYIRDRKSSVYMDDIELQDHVATQDSLLEYEELSYLIQEAVCMLPDKCKQIFLKSREENLSHREIAVSLNIAEKTVENQIAIALKKIKAHLKTAYYTLLLFF